MNSRIKQFMDYKKLTSSELADTIGVQRSNVTHVLHGRNKPSFQFIAKLLETYPEIDAKWLIMGEGAMLEPGTKQQNTLFEQLITKPEIEKPNLIEQETPVLQAEEKRTFTNPVESVPLKSATLEEEKDIERIVVFYTDQTFKQYTPSK